MDPTVGKALVRARKESEAARDTHSLKRNLRPIRTWKECEPVKSTHFILLILNVHQPVTI